MEEKPKRFRLNKIVLLIFVVLVVAAAGAAYFYKNQDKNSSASLPAGWSEYKSEKYKLSFTYPKEWGEPQLDETSGDRGKTYSINFSLPIIQSVEDQTNIQVLIDSNDLSRKVCDANNASQCTEVQGYTDNNIDARLAGDKSGLLRYDDNSYVSLFVEPPAEGLNLVSNLSIAKKLQLDSLNASAVRVSYTIHGSSDNCNKDNFSDNGTEGCITHADFEVLKIFLDSLRPLQ